MTYVRENKAMLTPLGAGADSLTGSSKADLLVGNDTPLGGAGSDWMFGGGALINAANDTNDENGLERRAA